MRYSRQNKILEIISKNDVETQDQLQDLLQQDGFSVTQATISRDIKELQLVKALSSMVDLYGGGISDQQEPGAGIRLSAPETFASLIPC